jgi:hypothetical protein
MQEHPAIALPGISISSDLHISISEIRTSAHFDRTPSDCGPVVLPSDTRGRILMEKRINA